MAIQLSAPRTTELKPRIVVFGIGGAGGNAVNNMIEAGLEGVEFVVANTDAQQLAFSKTERRIQLGVQVTQGLGAGAHPEVGMSAAEESAPEIGEHLDGAHMVFITAGMGGGTGTGAAPIIAKCARERGILTVGVVTKPFQFEGRHRMRLADAGIAELQRYVDTLIVIPNQNLFRVANERTTFAEAFGMADQVLHSGVRSITDLMVLPGLINLDFADVRTVMTEMGKAMMGTGEASGEDRALMAASNAIANPLLDEVSLKGAKAVLVNVTGGLDMTLLEVDEAANAISDQVDPEANIIFGAAFDPSLEGKIRVSVVATGMDGASIAAIEPKVQRGVLRTEPLRIPEPARTVAEPVAEPVRAAAPEAAIVHASTSTSRGYVQDTADRVAASAARDAYAEPEARQVYDEPYVAEPQPRMDNYTRDDGYAAQPSMGYEPRVTQPTYSQPAAAQPSSRSSFNRQAAAPEALSADEAQYDPRTTDRRQQKGGWLSLFGGRPRQEPVAPGRETGPVPQFRNPSAGQATARQIDEEDLPAGDDLEIPSFLRRLAN